MNEIICSGELNNFKNVVNQGFVSNTEASDENVKSPSTYGNETCRASRIRTRLDYTILYAISFRHFTTNDELSSWAVYDINQI